MKVHIRLIMLLAMSLMIAAACQRNYRTPPSGTLLYTGGPPGGPPPPPGQPRGSSHNRTRTNFPYMSLDVIGRYQSISSKIVTGEPLFIHYARDTKEVSHWLIPHFYTMTPAEATISNSYTVVQIDNGIWYAEGSCPVIITSKIRSVGTGTIMIVEINPGADFTVETDDIHRVYFLGPEGHGVNVYPIGGGKAKFIRNVGDYIEAGPGDTISDAQTYLGNSELEAIVNNVQLIVDNTYR